jgi:hypothetical protein
VSVGAVRSLQSFCGEVTSLSKASLDALGNERIEQAEADRTGGSK